jgi:hypothetical protein
MSEDLIAWQGRSLILSRLARGYEWACSFLTKSAFLGTTLDQLQFGSLLETNSSTCRKHFW